MLPIHPTLRTMFGPEIDEEITTRNFYWRLLNQTGEALDGMPSMGPGAQDIAAAGLQIIGLLLRKNLSYGNSALDPLAVFSQGVSVKERLGVRMDDKLSRLARGLDAGEDPALDLLGYLFLYLIEDLRSDVDDELVGDV